MALHKRTPTLADRDFGPVKIYLDDIIRIYQVLESMAEGDVHIVADDYQADLPDDLLQIEQEKVDYLRLEVVKPELTVEFSDTVAHVSATDPSLSVLGAMSQIESLMAERRRRTADFFARVFVQALSAALVSAIPGGSSVPSYSFRVAIVIPRYRKDAPSFWQRNRDTIAITFFFTLVGAVLGILATLAFFSPNK
jgi:hypothetical protein